MSGDEGAPPNDLLPSHEDTHCRVPLLGSALDSSITWLDPPGEPCPEEPTHDGGSIAHPPEMTSANAMVQVLVMGIGFMLIFSAFDVTMVFTDGE